MSASRQVITSGGQDKTGIACPSPGSQHGERGNAKGVHTAQCFRDDPRDRLSFPSKDGLF